MRTRTTTTMMALMLASAAVLAQQVSGFKSTGAKLAQTRYENTLKELDRDYQRKVTAARQDYINELKDLQKEATQSNNLDEAVRIREAIRDMEGQQKVARVVVAEATNPQAAGAERLREQLSGTTWKTLVGTAAFADDGIYKRNPDDGEDGRWVPVSSRAVVLLLKDQIKLVVLNEDMKSAILYWNEPALPGPAWTRIK